ncbi:MAG: hypothetical protein JXX14_17080 [Deltaproteobacteria bacterium]|nr:hypothetical protein [Deltaproteobacteria bacterium]
MKRKSIGTRFQQTVLKIVSLAMGILPLLFSGCIASEKEEPCSSGQFRCNDNDILQRCAEKEWQDYTNCPAINQICAVIDATPQCIVQTPILTGTDRDTDTTVTPSSDMSTDRSSDSDTEHPVDTDTLQSTEPDTVSDIGIPPDTDHPTDSWSDTSADRDTSAASCERPIRLGVLGNGASTANGANIASFFDWLSQKSNVQISFMTVRTTLDAEVLANYDVLFLLLQSDSADIGWWHYDATEIAAVTQWLTDGGGIITTAGYTPSVQKETDAINSLLSQTAGLTYDAASDTFNTCSAPECVCVENAVSIENWDTSHPVASHVSRIGALHGFRILSTGTAHFVATDENGDAAIAAVESGAGRVVAIGDEWPLFANMWMNSTEPQMPDEYSPCYNQTDGSMITAASWFQHPQFWYNVINWVSPVGTCMPLDDPSVMP